MRIPTPSVVVLAALAAVAAPPQATAQGLTLDGLAALAKERAARQRPLLERQLEPFATDLQRSYRDNRAYLEERFDEIANLGPAITPILLEYLTPKNTSPEQAQRAENAVHVLRRLEPAEFCDSLLDLMRGDNSAARRHAMRLLGGANGSRRAARALASSLVDSIEPEQLVALRSLTQLGDEVGLDNAVQLLASPSLRVRRSALAYVVRIDKDGRMLGQIRAAFQSETANELVGTYVQYLATRVRADAELATILLPFATTPRLPAREREDLVRALGRIAPPQHGPTIDTLEALIENGHLGHLEKNAALALQELGDKDGVKTISSRLAKSIKQRRNDAAALANRGQWHIQLERWRDASRDYEAAIKLSRSGAQKAGFYLLIARCEAHRGKVGKVKSALKNTGMSRHSIVREAALDPVFAAFLKEKDSLQRFLRSIE